MRGAGRRNQAMKRYAFKTQRRYGKRDVVIRQPRVNRLCLKCDSGFTAKGRFNRICPKCTNVIANY
jgi:hypothetical protein